MNFSCYVKRLSNKFNKILHLEREKVKNDFMKSANFAKIAKVTRLFLAVWKHWVTNMAKIAKNNKLNKILHLEREKVEKCFEKSANFAKIAKVTRLFLAMWKDWVINIVIGVLAYSKLPPSNKVNLGHSSISQITRYKHFLPIHLTLFLIIIFQATTLQRNVCKNIIKKIVCFYFNSVINSE